MPTMSALAQTSVRSLRHSSATRLRATSGRARLSALTLAALATGYYPDGSAPEPGFLKARRTGCFARSPHNALN